MTKKAKYAVLLGSSVGLLIGLKTGDFLIKYPDFHWWQALLSGIGYVVVLFVLVAVLIGLATLWLEK